MPSPQQTANEALFRWQALRAAGLSPDRRIEVLMDEFFAPPAPLDCEFDAIQREVTAIMEAA